LNGRKRFHEIVSEEAVSWDGELTADANGFLFGWVVWIGGGELLNGVRRRGLSVDGC